MSNAPSSPRSGTTPAVPYPGAPVSSDKRVVAGEGILAALLTLKGGVEGMGVLDSDEGLREGDLEALEVLWGNLKVLGERAKKIG